MKVTDQVRLVIYRVHEKGLEIFLVSPENDDWRNEWRIPDGMMDNEVPESQMIHLDPVKDDQGRLIKAVAIEGDWHDIPSIRGLIKEDVRIVKYKIKEMFPELEQGAYFAVKEAFKKVMPDEYALLKELKDILTEKLLVQYI